MRGACVSSKELSEAVIEANPGWVRLAGRFGEVGRALDAAADNSTNINTNANNANTNTNTRIYNTNSDVYTNANADTHIYANASITASANPFDDSYRVGIAHAHGGVSDAIYFPDLITFDNDSAEEETKETNSYDTITHNDNENDVSDLITFDDESEGREATHAVGLTAVTGSPGWEGWGESDGGVRGRNGAGNVPPGPVGIPSAVGTGYDAPRPSRVNAPPGLGAPFVDGAGFGAVVDTAPRAAALSFAGDSYRGSSFVRGAGGGGGRGGGVGGGWVGWGGPGAGNGGLSTWGVGGGGGGSVGGGDGLLAAWQGQTSGTQLESSRRVEASRATATDRIPW